jgi:fatty-acyl-CoA synthase
MAGAVLNALNTRLDPETIAFMLHHGEAKAVIVDPEFSATLKKARALRQAKTPLLVVDVEDALYTGPSEKIGWRVAQDQHRQDSEVRVASMGGLSPSH